MSRCGWSKRAAAFADSWHFHILHDDDDTLTRARRAWKIIRTVWITVGLGATVVFVAWSLIAYRATSSAVAAMHSDSLVSVHDADGQFTFTPRAVRPGSATLLFFPGALVDPRAYAPLARAVAQEGYHVVVVALPRRGAFGGADSPELGTRISSVLAERSHAGPIVAAGHSRGAVVASRLAANRGTELAGMVIIGSSHPRDYDLSSLTMPVTKIVGTRDGLASPAEVRENARLLPAHTNWVWIEGGNHSQFGWYGFQPLDRRPRLDAATQRRIMTDGVLDVLAKASSVRARP